MKLCSMKHCSQTLPRRHLESNWRCAPSSRKPSYPTLLETLATPWNNVEQCSTDTLSLVSWSKVASCGRPLCFTFFERMTNRIYCKTVFKIEAIVCAWEAVAVAALPLWFCSLYSSNYRQYHLITIPCE